MTSIVVRRPSFQFGDETTGHWLRGDPFLTHFFNALSSCFPEGERLFVASVRAHRDEIEDPALLEAIRGFSAQEGQHSKVHDAHVSALVAEGYPLIAKLNGYQRQASRWLVKKHPRYALATTAALEHLTATLADVLLTDPRWTENMSGEMRRLWRWHAVEELEHRAVAFDVYQSCYGELGFRRLCLLNALFFLFAETLLRHCYLLWNDPKRVPSAWFQGLRMLWGRRGLLTRLVGSLHSYWRVDFHPEQEHSTPSARLEQL